MADAFYVADGDVFVPTPWTRGPWSPDAQHGGPPAALLGRALERAAGRADMLAARVTFDILKPVPLAPMSVDARIVRGGRNVQLAEALASARGEEVMHARAWFIRTESIDAPAPGAPDDPPPGPESGAPVELFDTGEDVDYLHAMEWRFTSGAFVEPGPATAWVRMRHALVAGETVSPLTRVLVAADSASGVSSALDFRAWLFVNPDLSVYAHRAAVGEWICLDAVTVVGRDGIATATSVIRDERGPLGRGVQSLLVAPRRRP